VASTTGAGGAGKNAVLSTVPGTSYSDESRSRLAGPGGSPPGQLVSQLSRRAASRVRACDRSPGSPATTAGSRSGRPVRRVDVGGLARSRSTTRSAVGRVDHHGARARRRRGDSRDVLMPVPCHRRPLPERHRTVLTGGRSWHATPVTQVIRACSRETTKSLSFGDLAAPSRQRRPACRHAARREDAAVRSPTRRPHLGPTATSRVSKRIIEQLRPMAKLLRRDRQAVGLSEAAVRQRCSACSTPA